MQFLACLQDLDNAPCRSLELQLESDDAEYVQSLVAFCQTFGDVLAWSHRASAGQSAHGSIVVTFIDSGECEQAHRALQQLASPIRAVPVRPEEPEHQLSGATLLSASM